MHHPQPWLAVALFERAAPLVPTKVFATQGCCKLVLTWAAVRLALLSTL